MAATAERSRGLGRASWTIGNVELQIGRAVAVLDALAERGVDGCGASQVELLRQGLLAAGPVKELSVVGAQGETLCTDRGSAIAPRNVVATTPTANPNIVLDVVRLGDERMLRVRRLAPASRAALAAILPAELLLPQVGTDGSPFEGYARIALADDTIIGAVGSDMVTALRDGLVGGRARSDRYGITVVSAMGRHGVSATYDDLRRIGIVVTGLLVAHHPDCRAHRTPARPQQPGRRNRAGHRRRRVRAVLSTDRRHQIRRDRRRRGAGALAQARRFADRRRPLSSRFLESTDLILDMTRSLMRQVGDEIGPLLAHRSNMYVAFNIAPRHLAGDVLIDDIGSIFVGGPISTSQIVLEVTERYEIEDLATTRDLIASLQGLGCRVAIDDVGTGHNGLSYILKLGVDIIKIDKMFVDAIRTESHSQAIVETLVDLARNLRMQIVAEGVEDFEQVDLPARPRDQLRRKASSLRRRCRVRPSSS